MLFKIPVLLLYFITATSCTKTDPSEASSSAGPQEKTEAEIIQDSFKDFLGYITEDLRYRREVTISDCVLYMGNEITNYNIVIKYFVEKPEKRNVKLDLNLYRELFEYTCTKKNLSAQECANEWKDARMIEATFNDCLQWHNKEVGSQKRIFPLDYFVVYMRKFDEDYQITTDFFNEHTEINKDDFEQLNLVRFRVLFVYHCNKKNQSIQECAKDRIEEAILKDSFKDCLKWCSHNLTTPLEYINSELFIYYMGGVWQDTEVTEKYFEVHPEAAEKTEKIDLPLYCELFKYYCTEVYPNYKNSTDALKMVSQKRKNDGNFRNLESIAPTREHMIEAQRRVTHRN